MYRRFLSLLLLFSILFSFTAVPAHAEDVEIESEEALDDSFMDEEPVEENSHALTEAWFGQAGGANAFGEFASTLQPYFQARQQMVYQPVNSVMSAAALPISEAVHAESSQWAAAFDTFADRVSVQITDAVSTSFLDQEHIVYHEDGTVTVFVYEWTFFDYDDLSDETVSTDVSGFGIAHKLTLRPQGNSFVVLTDEYDASDVFGICTINESTFRELEEMDYVPVDTTPFLDTVLRDGIMTGGQGAELQYTLYSGYSPSKATQYADKYVCPNPEDGQVYESYYNSAYPNYNNVGGDCANYVSQCIYNGGMPMVVGTPYSNDGWYFKSASDRSATWTAASYLCDWMGNHRGKRVTATDDTVFQGCPVLYNGVHVTICVGYNSAGIPVINSHNNDRYHMKWNYWDVKEEPTVYETVQLTSVNAAKLAGVPKNVTVSAKEGTVTVSFSAAEYADSYSVYLIQAPWEWSSIAYSKSTVNTAVAFKNVSPGDYKAFVVARPNKNTGKQSEWVPIHVSPKTPDPVRITPSTNYVLSGIGDPAVVSWEKSANADYYICYLSTGDESTAITFKTSNNAVYLTDVPEGSYMCYVRAFNFEDVPSKVSNGTTIHFYSGIYTPKASAVSGKHQYLLFEESLPWYAARDYCEALGGHLATLRSAAEDAAVTNLLKSGSRKWYWLGGYRNSSDRWRWVDDHSVALTGDAANWGDNTGVSKDGPTGNGDFIAKNKATGTWYGAYAEPNSSTGKIGFVCEFDDDLLTVTFDANGGAVDQSTMRVAAGQVYGPLPVAVRASYVLEGWFTEAVGGDQVKPDTVVTETTNHVLYAHWKRVCSADHDYSYSVKTAPTTDAPGLLVGTCSRCKDEVGVTLPKLDKTGYSVSYTKTPTCTQEGKGTYTWKNRMYGTFSFTGTMAKLPHAYSHTVRPASCLGRGYDEYVCGICGHSYRENVTAALGHAWNSGTVSGETRTFSCTRCGDTMSGKADALLTPQPFEDVPVDAWFYNQVQWAVKQKITSGTTSVTFSPNDTCTRGQVVTFLWRAAGMPSPRQFNNPFTDVTGKDYYYKAVLWAVEQGITAGTSSTTFSPDDPCTRAQVVTFLYRAAGSPIVERTSCPFKDVKSSDFCYTPVLWAADNAVTSTASKTFDPYGACTRAQIVTFLYNYYG